MGKEAFSGIKIADFSWVIVGPLTIEMLAWHGAEVIRIESVSQVDVARVAEPFKDNEIGVNRGANYANYNVNKYGMTLNLRNPKGLELAKKIVAWADIVAESFRPGVMDRLGLGYQDLVKIKSDIIMISLSSQGQTGPHATHPAYGSQLASLAGLTHHCGWPDRDPAFIYGAYTDFIAPFFGAAALISALDYRRRTGKGQYLDLSQYEASLQFVLPAILDYQANNREIGRVGNRDPHAVPHGVYRCKGEDRWCAIAVFSDTEWKNLCKAMGKPELSEDPRFATVLDRKVKKGELDRIIEEWTINLSAEEVMHRVQEAGVGAGVLQNAKDLYSDPQLSFRQHFITLNHPEIGEIGCDAPPFRLSETPLEAKMPAPCLGEHNAHVCSEILGLSDEEFVDLMEKGAFE